MGEQDIWEGHGTPWNAGGVTSDRFVIGDGPETEGIFSLGDVSIFPSSGPGPVAIAAGAEMGAFIVKARNAHDALVKALQAMLVDPPSSLDEPDSDAEVIRKLRAIASDALAKLSA